MRFTDADLEKFKRAFIDRTRVDAYSAEGVEPHLPLLIARLEAAERYINQRLGGFSRTQYTEALMRWRKIAGKNVQ